MKYLDEFRDPKAARALLRQIEAAAAHPWTLMEVCGGQTHSIVRYGIDQLLPGSIRLVHGPGCPVCVTPAATIDKAATIAGMDDVVFTSFGDMLRVPGGRKDLFSVRSEGGDVRTVYSPLDAVKLAQQHPDRQVVFFAVGFETTAPATAAAVLTAEKLNLDNFSLLVAHVLVPPAITAILSLPGTQVQGFLAAGHVCAVTGYAEYDPIVAEYQVPIVVTGFEPYDLLKGVLETVTLLEKGEPEVSNRYARAVQREGNPRALAMIDRVFEECDREWRGIGVIPRSGWKLNDAYSQFDAEQRFDTGEAVVRESSECISGQILQGIRKPSDCPAFGKECTPQHPLGATMVSSEGACAAYYQYRTR